MSSAITGKSFIKFVKINDGFKEFSIEIQLHTKDSIFSQNKKQTISTDTLNNNGI
jgi:hypothetical protein